MTRAVKSTRKTLLVIVGLLVATSLLWWFYVGPDRVARIPFDSTGWQRADPIEHHRTVRSQMIDDLLRRHKFDGQTRQQVVELLGQPTGKWSGFEKWDIIYVLGLERSGAFSLDDEALGFKFDTTDRVVKYGLSLN
jgi:hypothetical protein